LFPPAATVRKPGGNERLAFRAVACGELVGSFDFHGCKADTVSFLERLVGGDRLPIAADQVVLGLAGTDFAIEQLTYCHAGRHFHIVRKTAALVVDYEHFHKNLWGDRERHEKPHSADSVGVMNDAGAVALTIERVGGAWHVCAADHALDRRGTCGGSD